MMFLDSHTHKWDTCAGEAIIRSMGGQFTTPFNTNIDYDPCTSGTKNKEGMIVAMNHNVHERCLGAFVGSRAQTLI